jgi:two-component system cell cycle sensor histidine kinase/response regulator CckA
VKNGNKASKGFFSILADLRQRLSTPRASGTNGKPEVGELQGVGCTLRTYLRCHQALAQARKERDLLQEICRILVEHGGYLLAWVGYAEHHAEKRVRPVAWAGEDAYLRTARLTWDDAARAHDPASTAIQTGKLACANGNTESPGARWPSGAAGPRPASAVALPLVAHGRILGALSLWAATPDAFERRQIELLESLADDLSHGILTCRLHAAQKHTTQALRETKGRYALARHAGHIGAWEWDLDTNEIALDPILKAMLGYEDHEIQNHFHDWTQYIHPDDVDQMIAAAAVHLGGLTPQYEVEHRMLHKDGTVRWCLARGTAIPSAFGAPRRLLGANMDITERKRLEEQLSLAQKLETVGRLAGGIAHDFNNYLTVICLSTVLLEQHIQRESPLWEAVQRIRGASLRSADLTRQLLSFSRQHCVHPRPLSLNQVVQDLSHLLDRIVGEDIQLRTILAPDLWLVEAYPTQVDQLILNLVLNARDAMSEGGSLTIQTANTVLDPNAVAQGRNGEPGDHVLLTVTDTGTGMAPEVQAHIFEPFFSTKAHAQGTGLGLTTVQGIVEQHKGHIRFDSQVGQGTTFKVYLPRAEADGVQAPAPKAASPLFQGTETILVVEDAVDILDLMVRTLRTHGYQVLSAKNGVEALQASRKHDGPIHLLLTDLVMPRMGGMELVEELQAQRPETQVLYMSGYADRPLVRELLSDPDTVLLAKPFTGDDLATTVRDVLDGRT